MNNAEGCSGTKLLGRRELCPSNPSVGIIEQGGTNDEPLSIHSLLLDARHIFLRSSA